MELVGKRGLEDLGSRINHVAGQGMSAWARKLLEKQGWKGGGLGKHQDGITDYVKVKQREESAGLGIEEHDRAKGRETWWYDSFEAALQSVKVAATGSDGEGGKKKKKKKKDKKEEASDGGEMRIGGIVVPTFDELFKATGGKRLGMRARASQKAKWERTEHLEASGHHHHHTTTTTTTTIETTAEREEREEEAGEKRKHKKTKAVTTTVVETTTVVKEEEEESELSGECERRRRKKEKKRKRKEAEAAAAAQMEMGAAGAEEGPSEPKSKKRKKKKDKRGEGVNSHSVVIDE